MLDSKAFGAATAKVVREYVDKSLKPVEADQRALVERVAALERILMERGAAK